MNFRNIIWGWQRKQLCTCDVCLPDPAAPQSLHCTENLLTWTFKVFLLLVCNFVFHELWYGYGFLNHCSWLINLQSLNFFKLPMDIKILVLWSWKLAWSSSLTSIFMVQCLLSIGHFPYFIRAVLHSYDASWGFLFNLPLLNLKLLVISCFKLFINLLNLKDTFYFTSPFSSWVQKWDLWNSVIFGRNCYII